MFVFSVRATRKHFITVAGCLAVVIAAIVTAAVWPKQAVTTAGVQAADQEARISYLRDRGCEVLSDSEEVREVRIPDKPDETLIRYSEQIGVSLEPYYGKRIRMYSYQTADGATAHLYVYKDRVVAGDVLEGGGFKAIV